MADYYLLEGKTPVKVADCLTWATSPKNTAETRRVNLTKLDDEVTISTVFLGLDHSWGGGPPLLFETMIFGGPHSDYQERYSTWDEAEEGHMKAVKIAKSDMEP